MDSFEKLVQIFEEFPGIGPRQARRFAFFLSHKNDAYIREFIETIKNTRETISFCDICKRLTTRNQRSSLCKICADENRNKETLMIVSKDTDISVIEKSESFNGTYFVLGGLIPILEKEPEKKVRLKSLIEIIEKKKSLGLKEIIFALGTTHEGENTVEFLKSYLKDFNLSISELGRGLSSGSEIEYADPETLRFALKNKN